MPFRKRLLLETYHRQDVFEDSNADTYLQDKHMSAMLGAMNQLSYLSSHSLEIFQNLVVLAEDVNDKGAFPQQGVQYVLWEYVLFLRRSEATSPKLQNWVLISFQPAF
jgi:hypothetical protein